MTKHLTPEEFVDALDRPSATGRQSHLATCQACADELADMRVLMGDVTIASEVPEPSPLFWDHLSARVREAVDAEPVPMAWWRPLWRPMLAAVGVLGVIAVAVIARPSPRGSRVDAPDVAVSSEAAMLDGLVSPESDAMWEMIRQMAPSIRIDDARAAGMAPGRAATDAAIESLTQAQRQELMKLLRKEMGSAE